MKNLVVALALLKAMAHFAIEKNRVCIDRWCFLELRVVFLVVYFYEICLLSLRLMLLLQTHNGGRRVQSFNDLLL